MVLPVAGCSDEGGRTELGPGGILGRRSAEESAALQKMRSGLFGTACMLAASG